MKPNKYVKNWKVRFELNQQKADFEVWSLIMIPNLHLIFIDLSRFDTENKSGDLKRDALSSSLDGLHEGQKILGRVKPNLRERTARASC
jgi:hypothetical protein